jgi:alanine racemase
LAKILLNKSNFFYNLDICSKQAKSKDKIAIVLKDNAYGHGLIQIAKLSQEYGLTKAVVRDIKEAQKIEKYFEQILILADTTKETLAHCFHITINSLEDINKIGAYNNVAIKIDTGMHRNGIEPNELEACIYRALEQKLTITSIFTHYKNADKLSSEYFWQKDKFKLLKQEVKEICAKLNIPKIIFHSSNSSGLFRDDNFNDNFARIGIAAYGYLENEIPLKNPKLKPVLSLITNKISTRVLKKNQSVGYGGAFTASKNMTISTYDIGYADGFLRIDPTIPFITEDGYKLLGRVSMDNMSLECDKDEICLFNNVKKLANIHNTITYEILTSLSKDLKREIII